MIDRRNLLAASGLATLASTGLAHRTTPAQAKTFVLVHGSWLGGWIWSDVAARLRAGGHRVYTPKLTGVGERHHLIGPDVIIDYVQGANIAGFKKVANAMLAYGVVQSRRLNLFTGPSVLPVQSNRRSYPCAH